MNEDQSTFQIIANFGIRTKQDTVELVANAEPLISALAELNQVLKEKEFPREAFGKENLSLLSSRFVEIKTMECINDSRKLLTVLGPSKHLLWFLELCRKNCDK